MIVPPSSYFPHYRYCALARPGAEIWRTVTGAVLIMALYFASLIALLAFLRQHYGDLIGAAIYVGMQRGTTPGALILLFGTFLGLAAAVFAATRLVHGRRAGSVFGPHRQAIRDFWAVAMACIGLNLAVLPFALFDTGVTRNLDLASFVTYMPYALLGILIQSASEELVFRGYLQQQLGARFQSPLIWMGLPSAIFACAHYAPETYRQNTLVILLWAGLFGVLAADLTARSGTLGAAIGFHFANNLAAFLLVGIDGDMDGLSLWSQAVDLGNQQAMLPSLATDFLGTIVAWLLARLVLRL
jgi:membrane protease YdiL (CAAX protease family)